MRRIWPFLLLSMSLIGCSRPSPARVRVFAAASLTDAFRDLGRQFEKDHPGTRIEFQFAGSQILRTQIEQGAPVDVFASANKQQMDPVYRAGLVESPRVFTGNRLVAIAGVGSRLRRLQDLAAPHVRVVMAAAAVPVGRYTREFLQRLAARPEFGSDFPARVEKNVMSYETNVRAVLHRVELGEADAGFVYSTDAASAAKRVRILPAPSGVTVSASYPIAVVRHGARPAAAFVDFVLSPRGQAVLARYGFAR